ncbi:Internalin-I [Symbiodinium microadriaticum]|uniref:Internalin-I n=1 Tax=Symbiodinium microadriaticum TaxID=2951 RepID=A0A1Q9EL61_SYMMI|nr:Internalin-I [Symbiodinium microadriaticum]
MFWHQSLRGLPGFFEAYRFLHKVLQLLNQIVGLRRLLYLGQANLWICVQRNTFFLVLFDAFVDAMFGAVLPACMVAEVAYKYQMGIDFVSGLQMCCWVHGLRTLSRMTRSHWAADSELQLRFVQAFLIGGRLVPTPFWPEKHRTSNGQCSQAAILQALAAQTAILQSIQETLVDTNAEVHRLGKKMTMLERLQSFIECLYGEISLLAEELGGRLQSIPVRLAGPTLRVYFLREFLVLERCGGPEFFPSLHNNIKLEFLYIAGMSRLKFLPPLDDLVALRDLQITGSQLEWLPDLSKNKALESLNVERNYLKNVLEEFPDIDPNSRLAVLQLSSNQIESVPSLPFPRLQELRMSANILTALPPLEVMKNSLDRMPSLQSNTELRTVDVSRNKLTHLPTLENAHQLEMLSLDARSNELEWIAGTITVTLTTTTKFAVFTMSLNRLTALSVRLPRTLRHLSVSCLVCYNRLTKLANLGLAPKLVNLKASNNQLRSVDGLEKMHALVVCNLEHNNITSLPSLEALSSLEIVSLGFNTLTELCRQRAADPRGCRVQR